MISYLILVGDLIYKVTMEFILQIYLIVSVIFLAYFKFKYRDKMKRWLCLSWSHMIKSFLQL